MSDDAMSALVAAGLEFRATKRTYDVTKKHLDRLKTAIRKMTKAMESDLELDGSTYYIPLGDEGPPLKVTRSDDDPVPPIDPQKFLSAVGSEEFFRFIHLETVPANAFDAEEWTRAVTGEEYTNQTLQDCLGEAPSPKAWSVAAK